MLSWHSIIHCLAIRTPVRDVTARHEEWQAGQQAHMIVILAVHQEFGSVFFLSMSLSNVRLNTTQRY